MAVRATRPRRASSSAAPSIATASRRRGPTSTSAAATLEELPDAAPTARPTWRRWRRPSPTRSDPVAGVILGQPNAFGRPRADGRGGASSRTPPARCSSRSSSRSRWRSSRRRASTAPTSRPARASRSASRRQYGGPSFGLLACTEALMRQIPGRLVGPHHRPRRPPRLRHDAARARAGHPPRQGRQQHLHQPGALRAGGDRLPRDARPARPARRRGVGCGRAHVGSSAPSPTSARRASTAAPYLNEFAVRVPDAPAVHARAPRATASSPACRWRAGIPTTRRCATRCCVCATELTTDARHRALRDRARTGARSERASRPTPSGPTDVGLRSGTDRGADARRRARRSVRASSRRSRSCRVPGRGVAQGARIRPPTRSTASRREHRRGAPLAPAGARRSPTSSATSRSLSHLNYSVDGGLLPAGLVHDEVQPQGQRVGRAPAAASRRSIRSRPTRWRRARSSCCGSSSGDARRDRRHARRSRSSPRPAPTAS